jgi:hypothetical protein
MKLKQMLICSALVVSFGSANDIMKQSMATMQDGMIQIQQGFLNNNIQSIRSGLKLIKEGNSSFSDRKIITQYLPKDKKHMINVAENQSKRISLNATVLELNLDEKSYINATNAYADILNACSRCHSIVRGW